MKSAKVIKMYEHLKTNPSVISTCFVRSARVGLCHSIPCAAQEQRFCTVRKLYQLFLLTTSFKLPLSPECARMAKRANFCKLWPTYMYTAAAVVINILAQVESYAITGVCTYIRHMYIYRSHIHVHPGWLLVFHSSQKIFLSLFIMYILTLYVYIHEFGCVFNDVYMYFTYMYMYVPWKWWQLCI